MSEWRDFPITPKLPAGLGAVWKTLLARSDLSAVIFGRKAAHDSGFGCAWAGSECLVFLYRSNRKIFLQYLVPVE